MIVNQKSIYYLRLFTDLLLLNAAFLIAAWLAQSWQILMERNFMFILLMALNFLWYFTANVVGFYDDFDSRSFSFQFTNIIKIITVQAIASVFFIFLVKEDLFTRNFIIIYSVLLMIVISTRIQLIRGIIRKIRGRQKNLRNTIIVGAGEVGQNFNDTIIKNSELGYHLVGFLDDNPINNSGNVIGSTTDLDKMLSNYKIDEVIAALPISDSEKLDKIIKSCNRHAVSVHIIPDYFRFVSKKFKVTMLGNMPIISVRDEPLSEIHWRFAKRTFDIFFSVLVSAFILSWMIPLFYLINKSSSGGKVLFVQDRIGTKNKIFKCYKFRTMKEGNDLKFQPVTKNDPRVTKLGLFLRKTNLDELPQFLNVVKGDMSVVGPRPHPIAFNEVYTEMVDEIKLRSRVKPGITGWAQVHGFRGDVVDYEENKKRTLKRIEFDIWYIENWSFWLDVQIILLTIWQMLKGNKEVI
jgi:putative colanic acid biosysnthesis UDP-glucose lipid carrier transferase